MRLEHRGTYPAHWPQLSEAVKRAAGNRCIRCQHVNDYASGHVLTVHHMDGDKANDAWWNLLALCQRCHLQVQALVIPERPWMFEHTAWFKPYVAGFYAWQNGINASRSQIESCLTSYLALGQPHLYATVRPPEQTT